MWLSFLICIAVSCVLNAVSADSTEFLEQPSGNLVWIEKSYNEKIPCIAKFPVQHCTWYKNDKEINIDHDSYLDLKGNQTEGNCTLHIKSVRMTMTGVWNCNVTDMDGNHFTSTNATVFIKKPPSRVTVKIVLPDEKKIESYIFGNIVLVPENITTLKFHIESIGVNPPEIENLIAKDDFTQNIFNITDYVIKDDKNNVNNIIANLTVPTNTNLFISHEHSAVKIKKTAFHVLLISDPKLYGKRVAIPSDVSYPLMLDGASINENKYSKISYKVCIENEDTCNELETSKVKNVISAENATKGLTKYIVNVTQDTIFKHVQLQTNLELFRYDPVTYVKIVSANHTSLSATDKGYATLKCEADGNPEPQIHWLRYTGKTLEKYKEGSEIKTKETGIYKCAASQKILEQERLKEAITVVKVTK